VLREQSEWTPERINEAMHGQVERTVKLRQRIPVYIGYWTARVSADGLVQFRKDVYGIDGRLRTKLAERIERLRKSATAAANAMTANKPAPDCVSSGPSHQAPDGRRGFPRRFLASACNFK
jgi:hypothetical protein